MKQVLTALFAVVMLAGCGVTDETPVVDEAVTEDGSELSASSRSWVTIRRDFRKCISPLCGGYWVADVNRKVFSERYVSALDFSVSGLDEANQNKVLGGIDELVLRGKLSAPEPTFNTRKFIVSEAYRGMPGVKPAAGDVFYSASQRSPAINCFTAPCPNEIALKLNSTQKTAFDSYSAASASQFLVETPWLERQMREYGAIAAGKLVAGEVYPGGPETVLDASQVYIKLPYWHPCPAFRLQQCPNDGVRTWTRDDNLCNHPTGCVQPTYCRTLQPVCGDGYTLIAWPVSPNACNAYACEASFLRGE